MACTNRKEFVGNIIDNFKKQTLKDKELILIVNSSFINVDLPEFTVLHYPEEVSLGECLNRGVRLAKYEYISKMDDDDYYGADYLKEVFDAFVHTNADIVGKSSFYLYFKRNNELRLYNPNRENRWIVNNGSYKSSYFLSGATLAFKKIIIEEICFPDVNVGEDSGFQCLCYDKGLKIYSLTKAHYAYLRYNHPQHHHSDASEEVLRRRSKFVATTKSLEDFLGK